MASAPRKTGTLHVIEPTLEDYAGHCYGLVRSLCEAAKEFPRVTLWAGRRAAQLEFPKNTEVHPYFDRRLRLPQLWLLLRRLLRSSDEPIVLTTAKRADLVLARLVARAALPPGRLYLYFQWFRDTPARAAFLRRSAAAQPHITILATTESVAETFKRAGFARVRHLPYPLTMSNDFPDAASADFRHLLFAGAARADKGFGHVVDLVELLQSRGLTIPITVQVSPEHYGKYDESIRIILQRLAQSPYRHLTLIHETLEPAAYARLFQGAICLQPYDRDQFKDRVSGVTQDALMQGAPIIGPSETWIAREIEATRAGIVLDDLAAANLLAAAEAVIASYDRYRRNALAARTAVCKRGWEPLLKSIAA